MALGGAYDPVPDPPVAVSGTLISFDGVPVNAGGVCVFGNPPVTNGFPDYIAGWPYTIYSNWTDQSDPPVYQSFIA